MASMAHQTQPARPAYGVPPGPQSPSAQSARSRGFSFRSDKSGGSGSKKDLAENPADKARRDSFWKGGSKANPNQALSELQPNVQAIYEESTIVPLRTVQHKDVHGNLITDPDLSNPTRPRLERPLDTIRSFEKAIDSGYRRRSNHQRAESYEQNNGNQYAGKGNSAYGEYPIRNNNYNKRQSVANRMSASIGFEGGSHSNRPANGGSYGGPRGGYGGGPPRGQYAQRMSSEPMMNSGRPYPLQHGHQYSQDTVATGYTNGSDSTGPWANETNPSSENSPVERGPASQKHPEYHINNGYGPNGYGPGGFQEGIPEEGGAYPGRAPAVQPPPSSRRPIALGNSGDPITQLPSTKRPEPEKRKSWLGRRFGKKN